MQKSTIDELGKMIRKFNESDLKDVLDIWLEGNVQAHPFIPESFWKGNLQFMTETLQRLKYTSTRRREKYWRSLAFRKTIILRDASPAIVFAQVGLGGK